MADFFYQYFIEPIEKGTGYNIVNTLTYAVLLIIAVAVIMKVLKRLGIRMDKRLWCDLLPFVILGGVVRALEDVHFFAFTGNWHFLFITPLIYIFIFALAFGSVLLTKATKKPVTRWAGVALLIAFSAAVAFKAVNWSGFAIIACLSAFVFSLTYVAFRLARSKLLAGANSHVLAGHVLDACASFTAISVVGGFTEQHVVPSALFSALPVWAFIPIKIFIVLLALYVIDREAKAEWNWMLKFTVLVLGMGPGVRDALTVLLGTNLA
jgi:uncharacterized membrane protein